MGNAFVLVDPTVGRERLCRLIARGFQSFHAFFRPRFLVRATTRRRANDGEDDYAKKRKKKHDPNPRGQRSA
jgi:hypothetical protein